MQCDTIYSTHVTCANGTFQDMFLVHHNCDNQMQRYILRYYHICRKDVMRQSTRTLLVWGNVPKYKWNNLLYTWYVTKYFLGMFHVWSRHGWLQLCVNEICQETLLNRHIFRLKVTITCSIFVQANAAVAPRGPSPDLLESFASTYAEPRGSPCIPPLRPGRAPPPRPAARV